MDIITIDGLAGAGKGTIARALARKIKFYYYDFGLIFRLGVYLYENYKINNLNDLFDEIRNRKIEYLWDGKDTIITVFGTECSNILISPEISKKTAELSEKENYLKDLISFAKKITDTNKSFICDGRNTGTTIFPEANFKFYVVASLETRTARRYKDLISSGYCVAFEKVLQDIQKRDQIDTQRKFGPTLVPKKAIIIDTDKLNIKECIEIMKNRIKYKGGIL